MKSLVFLFSLIVFCGCINNHESKWTKDDAYAKLKKAFPTAEVVGMFDSTQSISAGIDSLGLPVPAFKAAIREKQTPYYNFILYFYNSAFEDSSFSQIFGAVMKTALKAGLTDNSPSYLLVLPKFDGAASKSIVLGFSILQQVDSAYMVSKEKAIEKTFDVQAIKMKNSRLIKKDSQ